MLRLRSFVARLALLAGLVTVPAIVASAQPAADRPANGRRQLEASHLPDGADAPTLDGRIDDAAWRNVPPMAGFTQQEPNDGQPASEETEVRVLLDRRNLYVGIIAFDSDPSGIVFTQSRRDANLNESDSIQIILDTFNDSQNGFIFGTDPTGIEYDGQVAGEGSTGGTQSGTRAGSQRGQLSGFNANWDADWTVRSQITDRGWETEMAIPLKTLRYNPGSEQVWGFNVWRNIRRKNEQVFLQPIPRGYGIAQVSAAAQLTGLDLPGRRDIKATPFVATTFDQNNVVTADKLDRQADVGIDLKWGVTPSMTADFTLNTDFAQVEADDEQVNLTRFALFFPEKRPFFLENASTFAFGAPQQIDLFFSRNIGLKGGRPIDIIGGGRLSGKIGNYNVGVLNMQTGETFDRRSDALLSSGDNFTVVRVLREVGRSTFGGIFVNREGTGDRSGPDNYNRAYGLDAAIQASQNGKVFAFIAGSTSPGAKGTDYAGRVLYTYANPVHSGNVGYSQVGDDFNPEVGFLPRRGYRRYEARYGLSYQPKKYPWIRRFSPHVFQQNYYGLGGELQSSRGHYHFFEIQPANGGRFGLRVDREQDRPISNFRVYRAPDGRQVIIPPGLYTWSYWTPEYFSDPSLPISVVANPSFGQFYNGDWTHWAFEVQGRIGSKVAGSVGYTRDDISLPGGDFVTTLVPMRFSYAFTPLANIQALVQYNSQGTVVSSNVRLAMLNRSGTGLFVVYNDQRDTSLETRSFRGLPEDSVLGRSFIVKYTRLFDW
jgi:hypothetical protein